MRCFRIAACVALVVAVWAGPVPALGQGRQPLLMENKTTLFERVLTRPGARIAEGVGAPGGDPLPPFTPLYVYERMPVDGGGPTYLEVGTDVRGTVVGFLQEQETVPWRHSLVLAFAPRVERERTLFFENAEALEGWLDSVDLLAMAEDARRAIDAGTLGEDSPVISIEPEAPVDFEQQFYMLPILEARTRRLPTGFRVRNVKVASVTRQADTGVTEAAMRRRVDPAALEAFRAGVVFVIDASASMQPYIDRTRNVMREVLHRVEAEGLADRVRFGLVAYRDDPSHVRGIEYLVRTFADPNQIASSEDFATALAPLAASRVSTRAFAEDVYAAIVEAFESIDWSEFGARSLILVTDASAREGNSPFATTGLNTPEVAQLIRANGAALYVLHLQTPVGANDHAVAEAQYRQLARFEGLAEPLFYPIPSGDPELFRSRVGQLADALIRQVQQARSALVGGAPTPDKEPSTSEGGDMERAAMMVGRAMALAHLGRAAGIEAPAMFEAWASDRDFANPDVATFSVRLLVSKNQLSDLQRTLQLAVEALEQGQIEPDDLFNQLRSASAAMGRDPSRVGQGEVRNLAETGLMGEYLDGLPYQSRLMSLTEDDWFRMGLGDQQAIIDDAMSKMRLYQRFHDDTRRWIALNDGDDPGDHVYPVPIDVLP